MAMQYLHARGCRKVHAVGDRGRTTSCQRTTHLGLCCRAISTIPIRNSDAPLLPETFVF